MMDSSPTTRHSWAWIAAVSMGILAGWIDVQVDDRLFTALLVLAFCMFLGFMRPVKVWRWVLLVWIFVPIARAVAYLARHIPSDRGQIGGAVLTLLPGAVGAIGGMLMRKMVQNIFPPPRNTEEKH
jgi:uncharacterized membrane protein YeaQ/YmgE (transglycosylase-associated protein family)